MKRLLPLITFLLISAQIYAQTQLKGTVLSNGNVVPYATVGITGTQKGAFTDEFGQFLLTDVPLGKQRLQISAVGYVTQTKEIEFVSGKNAAITIHLEPAASNLNEVVVSGTLKAVSKMDSPVPVEVYSSVFFKRNPTPSIFDALQNINGVRPQLNCNVCNTGDIHINGLEGPYTMVMIDGMPIVSSLSTVYGLSGIPNSLVDRVEIVKGPASTLYGSEAVAGLINIITKDPSSAPLFSADVMTTSWQEHNIDLGMRLNAGKKATSLIGVNYYNYSNPTDFNKDNFTDVTLQHRISVFNKWGFKRKADRQASIAGRFFYEHRWGGEMQWNKSFRGTDQVYGESIYTNRFELIGSYQLPTTERILFTGSFNYHNQDSYYGETPFMAKQMIAFSQFTWDRTLGKHNFLAGLPLRYTYYDDNTPATVKNQNPPKRTYLPGFFLQDEIKFSPAHTLLGGLRYDYNSTHGSIWTPRLAYKYAPNYQNIFRLNFGTGYRVVSIFTEDHAALSGAREVVINGELSPEQSWNINLNYTKKIPLGRSHLGLDASAFYTYFSNKIVPDYSSQDTIFYENMAGHAISRGFSLNVDWMFHFPLKLIAGVTYTDVYEKDGSEKIRPMLTERVMGTWSASYTFKRPQISVDYTGNLYGSMLLPLVGDYDPRPGTSPVWSIQNIQVSKKWASGLELYGGVKNLLNFRPPANAIARAHDPFDKLVDFNPDGSVMRTPENPYGLTFDPAYVFAPNQGIRGFLGIRFTY